MQPIRTRFAPSPTGQLHIGGVRAALFPWLLARRYGGSFILRIEDTDQSREVSGAIDTIKDSLKWLGLDWDEGPDIGGPYAPYIQSQRRTSYLDWANRLVHAGRAYADDRSTSELDQLRLDANNRHRPFLARDYRPTTKNQWQPGTVPLRFLSEPKAYTWHDEIMGELSAGADAVDDFILIKSDGLPTYNFAYIIDDFEMKISHVIRGLEYIASMPKYLNLYEALELSKPKFAHMPHILGPEGNKKLSKRDNAMSVLEYKEQGYLPEAMINFLALLGWNPGIEQEIFTLNELIEKFSLERVGRSGARFDERRLLWMDGNYIRNLPLDELYIRSEHYWPPEAESYPPQYKKNILNLVQERLKFLGELPQLTRFFFVDLPIDTALIKDNKKLAALSSGQLSALLNETLTEFNSSDFTAADLNLHLNQLLTRLHESPAVLFGLIRIATTQAPASPPLAEYLALIGKEKTIARIKTQLEHL